MPVVFIMKRSWTVGSGLTSCTGTKHGCQSNDLVSEVYPTKQKLEDGNLAEQGD